MFATALKSLVISTSCEAILSESEIGPFSGEVCERGRVERRPHLILGPQREVTLRPSEAPTRNKGIQSGSKWRAGNLLLDTLSSSFFFGYVAAAALSLILGSRLAASFKLGPKVMLPCTKEAI